MAPLIDLSISYLWWPLTFWHASGLISLWAPHPDVPLIMAGCLFTRQEIQIMKPTLTALGFYIWPTFTFSLALAYLRLGKCMRGIGSQPNKEMCWEKLRPPANCDWRTNRWVLNQPKKYKQWTLLLTWPLWETAGQRFSLKPLSSLYLCFSEVKSKPTRLTLNKTTINKSHYQSYG